MIGLGFQELREEVDRLFVILLTGTLGIFVVLDPLFYLH